MKLSAEVSKSIQFFYWKITSFSKTMLEGAVSNNISYFLKLSIARYKSVFVLTIILSSSQ